MAKQRFRYIARNQAGRQVKGKIDGENEEDIAGRLRQQGLSVVSVEEAPPPRDLNNIFGDPPKKCKQAELALFTRQLATMLAAGVALLESLEILAEQATESNKGFGAGLKEVAEAVRAGTGLSEVMAQYPKIFPDIYINMIKAGEASGQLDTILSRLADYMEASESLKREIKSAMTYPVISLVLVIGIAGYLLVGVVPKFEEMFNSLGATLPAITVIVLDTSKWLTLNWYYLIAGIIVLAIFYMVISKNKDVRRFTDAFWLKIPVFGSLNQKVSVSRFARTFATLLASGVPILGALEIVATTSGNQIIEDAVLETRETVRAGESLTTHLATCWVFPPMVVRMIAIGEKSGALEDLLTKISDFYDEQVHATVNSLTSLIEPIMISIMGAVVGTIVIAIFLPILELQKALS